jgi:hypothetical protein
VYNDKGLPGRIVTLAATPLPLGASKAGLARNVNLTPDKPGASREREPHTGQAGSIVRREAGTKTGSDQMALKSACQGLSAIKASDGKM